MDRLWPRHQASDTAASTGRGDSVAARQWLDQQLADDADAGQVAASEGMTTNDRPTRLPSPMATMSSNWWSAAAPKVNPADA